MFVLVVGDTLDALADEDGATLVVIAVVSELIGGDRTEPGVGAFAHFIQASLDGGKIERRA